MADVVWVVVECCWVSVIVVVVVVGIIFIILIFIHYLNYKLIAFWLIKWKERKLSV